MGGPCLPLWCLQADKAAIAGRADEALIFAYRPRRENESHGRYARAIRCRSAGRRYRSGSSPLPPERRIVSGCASVSRASFETGASGPARMPGSLWFASSRNCMTLSASAASMAAWRHGGAQSAPAGRPLPLPWTRANVQNRTRRRGAQQAIRRATSSAPCEVRQRLFAHLFSFSRAAIHLTSRASACRSCRLWCAWRCRQRAEGLQRLGRNPLQSPQSRQTPPAQRARRHRHQRLSAPRLQGSERTGAPRRLSIHYTFERLGDELPTLAIRHHIGYKTME